MNGSAHNSEYTLRLRLGLRQIAFDKYLKNCDTISQVFINPFGVPGNFAYSRNVGSSLFLSADDENLKKVREKYGKTHTIEAVKGTKVIMAKLTKNQSVCWGDGESYHFRLTAL